ncbi:TRM-domain-containing protein [Stemphylium lycopersici]|uniref:tRNA (guanine(26)-N(2))-dimethyltransferase n=1 Tax=Stemphylium lycopersici TaxID=183478 RepID=A0A364N2B3_STELY|nr:dimethylguanosine trna methyltransferase [Stemphylium lycopersici]RAR01612.1 TRM-domain-containing protein [Stemphylium lycopersici]RAR10202.1 TRM-domain-containing protein [Stemphylium lycopersici]
MASNDVPMADAPAQTIDAMPQAGQHISHEGQEYTTIKEGLAHILVPHDVPTSTDPRLSKEETQKQQVFYNPIQQFNRDLSVLAIKTFGRDCIERKSKKHEQFKKKNERKKHRAQENRAAQDATNDVNEAVKTSGADGDVSLKRKLADNEMDDGAGLSKKQKVVENGDNELDEEHGEKAAWKPSFSILDALSATGLRALRYAQEIPFATAVTANDMSKKAVDSINLNVKHNKLEDTITANTGNAIAYMYSYCDKKGYDVIDLDPYGTAAPFIDSAIQAINDDGMLCVTCTDSAIFASHGYLEKTYSQYGGLPFKGEPCHEGGLRLILHAIASSAARYGMAIEPLLSLSIDYYIRVFVRVRKAPNDVKLLAGKTMLVYHCESGCGAWSTQFLARNKVTKNKNGDPMYKYGFAQGPSADQHCEHCGHKTHLSGPMYGGPLHNVGFVERVLAQLNEVDRQTYPTMDRIEGMLHTALEEITFGTKLEKSNGARKTEVLDPLIPKADPAEIDHHPFFFIPSSVAKVVHCSAPPLAALRGALRHAGFRVTMSHCKPGSIKTDASWKDIWHVMLEWVRQRAPLKNMPKKGSAGHAIMAKASATGHTMTATADPAPAAVPADADTEMVAEVSETTAAKDLPAYLNTKFEVCFDEKLGKDHDRGKYVRYQLAPRENWGPMSRAK